MEQNESESVNSDQSSCWSFATKSIHVGNEASQWKSRCIVPPIVMSTTFHQFEPNVSAGYVYGRTGNPTREALEKCIASLEDAQYALCFATGLSTLTTIAFLLESGDHIVAGDLYGGTDRFFRNCAIRFNLHVENVDFKQTENVTASIKQNTKMVWFETPTNPLMNLSDIKEICQAVKKKNPEIIVVVDNTFMSPYFQKPLNLGADISMNSITKYMNGHSDVLMGCIATNQKLLYERLKYLQNALGGIPSPFDCFLVNRGLKTLAVRMEQHQINALAVAHFLENHSAIEKVLYPGLESHPQHQLAKKQTTGNGGMISIYIKGSLANARALLLNLKIFVLGESLGTVKSLIEIPSLMTHASIPIEVREELGILDNLLRISIGIENVDDLIKDLDQALIKSQQI